MKRKFTDINTDSDSDAFTAFQSRKRRRRIVEASSCSDEDTSINLMDGVTSINLDEDNDEQHERRLSMLHLSSSPTSDKNTSDESLINNSPNIKSHKTSVQTTLNLQQKSWYCEACTFKNETNFTECEICDTKRNKSKVIHVSHDTDTINTDSDADGIENEDNDFKRVHSTKQSRNKDNKLKKQTSIVDLTASDTINDSDSYKSTSKKMSTRPTKITGPKPKKKKKQTKKQTKKKKDGQKSIISFFNGKRSRSKHYSNLMDKQHKKKKKRAISKTESIESVQENELLNISQAKVKNIKDSISDDNDVVILNKVKKSHANKRKKDDDTRIIKEHKNTIDTTHNLHSEQWIDKYAPKTIDDLYLHKRKLQEIDEWFCNAFKALDDKSYKLQRLQYVKTILFLVGQSGIGKTSTIQCLCKKYNAKLLCYPNMDANVKTYNTSIWDNDNTHFMNFSTINRRRNNIDIKDESQMNKLDAFLNRSKRFGSLRLFGGNSMNTTRDHTVDIYKRQVIWIRELPYVGQPQYLHRFREIVQKMCNSTRNIVIFEITTEFEGTRDDLQIFGNEIRLHPRVTSIRFNPINNTLMKRCLNDIIAAENMKIYIANINSLIMDIIENEKGDLRNAIQTLQMRLIELFYSNIDEINAENKIKNKSKKSKRKKTKKRGKKSQLSSLKSLKSANVGGREETLSLFHCLGKVLYAKKNMEPEEAIEKSDLDCIKFNDLLYENFGDYFIYNEHFMPNNGRNTDTKPKEVDEFGFEIDLFDDATIDTQQNNVFEKYCETLNYFGDADICCQYYNTMRYSDTSTDLRSTVNHIQFGSQLYPAIYAASISARGYLIAHNKQPKLKLPQKTYGYKKKRGLNAIRGSTYKLATGLRNELCSSFTDAVVPRRAVSFGAKNEHYVSANELPLIRALMCQPTALYVDMLPYLANMNRNTIEKECHIPPLCVSLITVSNQYSQKYEHKTFVASRFDYLQKSMTYSNKGNHDDIQNDEEKELVNQIEEYCD